MRAEVNLDADVYTFAKDYASAHGIPLGATISQLLRRVEKTPEVSSAMLTRSRRGLLVKAKGNRTVTPEMAELSQEDLV